MHDLPSQTLLQQVHARPVSGEELEVFGKYAAKRYADGVCGTLNDAVIETVKHAGLSPEQVKRVVEFTNQSAYLMEFKKESSAHKYIEFRGGPASPSEVLKDLNDGGGGTVFDRGMADYASPPTVMKTAELHARNRAALGLEKTAAVAEALPDPAEIAFQQAFAVEGREIPFADPYQDSIAMRCKLASIRDDLNSELSSLEMEYLGISEHLFDLVKQAALEGVPLGHVVQAWRDLCPGEGYVKCAFQIVGPRLVECEAFPNLDGVAASLEKTAGASAMPNHDHPLLKTFAGFCAQLDKLAAARAARDEASNYFDRVDWFIKAASEKEAQLGKAIARQAAKAEQSGGLLSKGWDVAKKLSTKGGEIAGSAAARAIHPAARKPVQAVVEHIPELGAALAAKEVYDRGIKYGPGQIPLRYAKSHLPGTREYYVRQYNLQQGMMPM